VKTNIHFTWYILLEVGSSWKKKLMCGVATPEIMAANDAACSRDYSQVYSIFLSAG
jgi:hypothetical protein